MKQNSGDWTRRDFLKTASAATLSALMAKPLAMPLHAGVEKGQMKGPFPAAKADSVIVLWMAGGMAHTETFDPKRHTPFVKGMKSSEVVSTFPSHPTVVDGIELSEGLQEIGSVMDRGTLIRTHVLGDLGSILHSRHQFHWHTGYEPPLTVAAPHLGAWLSYFLGPRNEAMPAFIDIGQPYDGNGEAEELKAFQTAGILGSEFGPFRVPSPSQAVKAVRPPSSMDTGRFQSRYRRFKKMVEASPVGRYGSDYQKESMLRSLERSYALMESPSSKAFDLSLEPEAKYQRYNTGNFGLGCLLARRLVEEGARFIEVSSEYVPFFGWDTHDNGHTRLKDMKRLIDAPIAQLVLDLEERGLLDRTLIVLASEFSRSVLVEGKTDKPVPDQVGQPDVIEDLKNFGMHRHFTGASSVLMFGGGVKKGALYGRTAEESPCTTLENPVSISNLHASIYHAMGMTAKHHVEIEKRPFYVTKDGLGEPVLDLFA